MSDLPTGVLTFLFTDVQGSTRLWEQHREAMLGVHARHDTIPRRAIEANDGRDFKAVSDAFYANAADVLAAALDGQRWLLAEAWREISPLRVRRRQALARPPVAAIRVSMLGR